MSSESLSRQNFFQIWSDASPFDAEPANPPTSQRQIRTSRSPINCLSTRHPIHQILYTLILTITLMGCTNTPSIRQTNETRLAWTSFFNGLDLRAGCRPDGPDRLRLVFHRDDKNTFTVFELLRLIQANRAFSTKSTVSIEQVNDGPPWEQINAAGDSQTAIEEISPRHFAVVVFWLEQHGVFHDSESGLILRRIGSFDWIATGCLRGGWFSSSAAAIMSQEIGDQDFPSPIP